MKLRQQVKRLKGLIAATKRTNQHLHAKIRTLQTENQALREQATVLSLEIERLRIETFTDPLTGAYNRTGLRHVWSEVAQDVTAVMIIDSDRFKAINDRYGHRTGDVVICHIGEMIRTSGIIAARTMGDEFIGLVTDQEPEKIAEQLRAAIAEPRIINGNNIVTTVTIGLCLVRQDDDGLPTAPLIEYLDHADAALYQGKRLGRNTIVTSEI
jgi:diguanylate cyclase (GGDEF)-like protein